MQLKLRTVAAAAALAMAGSVVSAQTLTFEDANPALPALGVQAFPSPYGGLTFTYVPGPVTDPNIAGSWQLGNDPTQAVAGNFAAFTEAPRDTLGVLIPVPILADSKPITGAMPFFFGGAQVRSYDDGIPLQFKYFSGGSLVGASTLTTMSFNQIVSIPAFASAIDTIVVSSAQGYFGLDNLQVTPVPEPGTYALMLAGLGVVGWMARRRKTTEQTAANEPAMA